MDGREDRIKSNLLRWESREAPRERGGGGGAVEEGAAEGGDGSGPRGGRHDRPRWGRVSGERWGGRREIEWVPWIGVEERFPLQRGWRGGFSLWRKKGWL
jgi:hypothetical protein